jgi:hypothetical protein
MKLNAVVRGFTVWRPFWDEFLSSHAHWVRARLHEGDEFFFVPTSHATEYACAFALRSDEIAAENAFTNLCQQFHIVGVRISAGSEIRSYARFIEYEGVQAPDPNPDSTWLERGREIGWTDEFIRNARIGLERLNDIQLRVTSAAGRLLCTPKFLAERDALRERWTRLPDAERLPLPLRPIVRVSDQPVGTAVQHPSAETTQFVGAFETFCQEWEINGFETWDLPLPRGPHWPELCSVPSQRSCKATLTLNTPWHFVALDSDGLGDLAMEQLRAEQKRHGIDDERAWRTYAQLFRLGFWEAVLRRRYADRARPRNFVSQTERLLAELLEVSLERVERLRKLHSALKAGRRRSLAGVR